MSTWHLMTMPEVTTHLETDYNKGLDEQEVARRLEKHGKNELKEAPPRSLWSLAYAQLKEVLVLMLLGAAIISTAVGEWQDALVIIVIVALNTALGVYQEHKAEQALRALKKLSKPIAKVVRAGHVMQVDTTVLVPGDVVILEAGDHIPADVRLAEVAGLQINEAALTGESVPVEKHVDALSPVAVGEVPIGDQHNMAFMGTVITRGRGRAVVVKTGMNTQIGNIARLLQESAPEATPLQRRLEQLGKTLGVAALVLVALVFAAGLWRGEDVFDMFMTAISLAVAAVPEGLPAVVTIVLALGVQRMSREKAIIRKLPAVETLGAATIICSDKTGTLTKNEMTVVAVYADGEMHDIAANNGAVELTNGQKALLAAATLASDAYIEQCNGQWKVIGDPTEGALIVAANQHGMPSEELVTAAPRVAELPFDATRKMMTTFHDWSLLRYIATTSPYVSLTKGAPDILLARCTSIWHQGTVTVLDAETRKELAAINDEMAGQGLRVLAVAWHPWPSLPATLTSESIENELVFMGYVAMQDPPRPEVQVAVERCKQAGIRPVMITGDHRDTAVAIARHIGLWHQGDVSMTGTQIEQIDDDELLDLCEKVTVYARVSPEHKLRIVDAYKKRGHVVAMTGDGVNDAPALKRADIGAAMGITGTDVAKEAADMVLADDNFATIVSAVASGRTVFANIRKVIHYLLSCNTGEIVTIFTAIILGLGRPLTAIQILWMNLVTDGLPALALGVEPAEANVMSKRPRNPKEGVLAGGLGSIILWQGLMLGGLAVLGYWLVLSRDTSLGQARTVAFLVLSLAQISHSFNTRSMTTPLLHLGWSSNKALLGAAAASILLQIGVVVIPQAQPIFDTVPLTVEQWLLVAFLSLAPLMLVEGRKLIRQVGA